MFQTGQLCRRASRFSFPSQRAVGKKSILFHILHFGFFFFVQIVHIAYFFGIQRNNPVVHPLYAAKFFVLNRPANLYPQILLRIVRIRNDRQTFNIAAEIMLMHCKNFLLGKKSHRRQPSVLQRKPDNLVGIFLIFHIHNSRLQQMLAVNGKVNRVVSIVFVRINNVAERIAACRNKQNMRPDLNRINPRRTD